MHSAWGIIVLLCCQCAVAAYAQTCATAASGSASGKQYSIALFINQVNTSYNSKQTLYAARLAVAQINAQNILGSNDTLAISNGGQPHDLGTDVRIFHLHFHKPSTTCT